jgi:3-isopropylmalate/(R)-2-methylmalate dehydratase small subunit
MEPFISLRGVALPLPLANLDTDVIIRVDRMANRAPAALRKYAFEALRVLPDGTPNPASPFNQTAYAHAPILIAGDNFGCGSSREPAVWAIAALGIRCVIAESFGDIFYSNCFQNGLLPVVLARADIEALLEQAEGADGFSVDLPAQTVTAPDGREFRFEVDPLRKELLLEGLDEVAQTLKWLDEIRAWQAGDRARRPWMWSAVSDSIAPRAG